MSFYLIDNLEQGSSEWHAWRKGVIGASDAPKIMGENPWGSRASLLDEKLGLVREFQGNAKTREGNSLEGDARKSLETKFKLKLVPTIVQDSKEPFLAASLDAICRDHENLFEIKAGVKAYEYTQMTKSVPDYYIGQLQHMLMVTEMDSLTYAVYRPDKPLLTLTVHRNDRYIKCLRKKEIDFANELLKRGHKIQKDFVGELIGHQKLKHSKKVKNSDELQPYWEWQDDVLVFFDGTNYVVGNEPGMYILLDSTHYWDGESWFLPNKAGVYNCNGDEYFWNGDRWE